LSNALLVALTGRAQDADASAAGRDAGAMSAAAPGVEARKTAEEYYRAGQYQQCAGRLSTSLTEGHPDRLLLFAACSYFAGDFERSSHAAAALAALQPQRMDALYWSIKADERLAFQSLARFQQLEPDSARSHILLGDIYRQRERFDDAQTEYKKALDIAPGDPAAMLGLASAYLANNNIEKTMETARAALLRSPNDPELNLVMGEAMIDHHDFAQAEPFLAKSMNAKPQMLPHVHALLGKVFAETGRTQDAISELKMGASSDEDGTLQYQLARLYHQLGDAKDASAALERMKEIKQQRRERGVKAVEDSDLPRLESAPTTSPTP
jgi:predicted Zn-dependent protease